MHVRDSLRLGVALMLAAGAAPLAWAAVEAGTVLYAFGQVQADGADGARALRKGDTVYAGETLRTGNGRTQVRFTDGGFAALQPDTRYAIDEYRFAGGGGDDRSFFSLLKGSVRFVTGAIGKVDRKSWKMHTTVATIGIRGSAGRATTDGETFANVVCHRDGLTVTDLGGKELLLDPGQGAACGSSACELVDTGSTAGSESQEVVLSEEERATYTQGETELAVGSDVTLLFDQAGGIAYGYSWMGQNIADIDHFKHVAIALRNGEPIAGVDLEEDQTATGFLAVDLDALLSSSDPRVVTGVQQLIAAVDASDLQSLRQMPATLSEFDQVGDFSWGGWSNGYVLDGEIFDYNGETQVYYDLIRLQDHQAVRIFYGPKPDAEPAGVFMATYDQLGDFFASSASGNAAGTVSNGELQYVFGINQGWLYFDVNMDNGRSYSTEHFVSASNFPLFNGSGFALGSVNSPSCHPSCSTLVNGAFIGHDATANGRAAPEFFGASWFIYETDDGMTPNPVVGTVGGRLSGTAPYLP